MGACIGAASLASTEAVFEPCTKTGPDLKGFA